MPRPPTDTESNETNSEPEITDEDGKAALEDAKEFANPENPAELLQSLKESINWKKKCLMRLHRKTAGFSQETRRTQIKIHNLSKANIFIIKMHFYNKN